MRSRTFLRTGLVLLAAGLVIAVTWAGFSPYDTAADLATQETAANGQAPAPGAEAALRRLIAAPPWRPPRPGTDVTSMGPLRSISYLGWFTNSPLPGLGSRIDNFLVRYRNGALFWRIGLNNDGQPATVIYFNPEPMTAAQTISFFSTLPMRMLAIQVALQLVSLLVIGLIGRFVLRIRM